MKGWVPALCTWPFVLPPRAIDTADTLAYIDSANYVLYNTANRHERSATWSEGNAEGRWRRYSYEELAARDKANLDIFWLRDTSLEDSANFPEPDVLAAEIIEDLRAALEQFSAVAEALDV